MPVANRIPSDYELRNAVNAIRVAWLASRFVSDRLLWAATNDVLDADMVHQIIRDELVARDSA